MSEPSESLPTIDDVVFSLGRALPKRLLRTAQHPEWHFDPEEVRRGIVSGRTAVIGFMDDGGRLGDPDTEPDPDNSLVFVAPAVRVRRSSTDQNTEYPHITHGEMLASAVCRAWDIPYSYRDFLALAGRKGMPELRPGTTGKGSRYFRYDSNEGVFLLQGMLPRDQEALTALRPTFEAALGDSITVRIGHVPPHLYHLRATARA